MSHTSHNFLIVSDFQNKNQQVYRCSNIITNQNVVRQHIGLYICLIQVWLYMHEISSSYLDCLQYRDGFILLVPNIWLVHIIYCLSFFCPLHFEFHNEMFSSVSNKLFKMVHLAFATTGSLFSSKTHSAKDFYIIKVQI